MLYAMGNLMLRSQRIPKDTIITLIKEMILDKFLKGTRSSINTVTHLQRIKNCAQLAENTLQTKPNYVNAEYATISP